MLFAQFLKRGSTGLRIDTACVGDDFDAACSNFLEHAFHRDIDKISRVAEGWVFCFGIDQKRHGQLRQVVKHQVVDAVTFGRSAENQLRCA